MTTKKITFIWNKMNLISSITPKPSLKTLVQDYKMAFPIKSRITTLMKWVTMPMNENKVK
jgi:hypothetical protein